VTLALGTRTTKLDWRLWVKLLQIRLGHPRNTADPSPTVRLSRPNPVMVVNSQRLALGRPLSVEGDSGPHQRPWPNECPSQSTIVPARRSGMPHARPLTPPRVALPGCALKVGSSSPLGHPRSERSWAPSGPCWRGIPCCPLLPAVPRTRGTAVVWRELSSPLARRVRADRSHEGSDGTRVVSAKRSHCHPLGTKQGCCSRNRWNSSSAGDRSRSVAHSEMR